MLSSQCVEFLLHFGEPKLTNRQGAQDLEQTKLVSHRKGNATLVKMEHVKKLIVAA